MVSASKSASAWLAALPKVAASVARKLSAATVVGLVLATLLLERIPPFLAAPAPAAPVEVVRTLPVPYLDARTMAPEASAERPKPAVDEPEAKLLQMVARRVRARRQSHREGESGALGKSAAEDSPAKAAGQAAADPKRGAAESKAAAPTGEASKGEAPEPDVWSDAEIIAGLRDCLRRLAPLGADIDIAPPIKQERCGTAAPVVLKRIGSSAGKVDFLPPPTLNCAMVASLHTWVDKVLQPAAQELLGSQIVRVRNASGYSCRNRVGTLLHADRLSEHALANAVDISGFVTADGRTVDVLAQWGPTARDLREEQERAWAAAQEAKAAAKQAETEAAQAARAVARAERGAKRELAVAEAERKKEEAARRKDEAQSKEAAWRKSLARAAEMQKLGRGTDGKAIPVAGAGQPPRLHRGDKEKVEARDLIPVPPVPGSDHERKAVEAAFLRRLHKGACGTFGTVLGPDANEAHRNHFHFDLAARKRTAFCE